MIALLALVAAQVAPAPQPACDYDKAAMLRLDERRFDQDMTGGWRVLNNAGCDAAAADLIAGWRLAHPGHSSTLFWHEGQLRANVGQTERAVALFERSRRSAEEDAGLGWNLYVDGSIAFLRRDRPALEAARASLAALPRPAGYAPVDADGKPRAVRWPLNLNVLDGFLTCWDKSYKEAYGCGLK